MFLGCLACIRPCRDQDNACRVAAEPHIELGSKNRPARRPHIELGSKNLPARRFKWAEIESTTLGFSSRIIGEGGFSTVYLACFTSSTLAAVKVHRSSERLHRAFRQELHVLLSLNHPHIVRLLGFCDEQEKGVLVFEFARNGDLHKKLHDGNSCTANALTWARRMAIALQIATALEYLHEGCVPAVIHGDIKASNVLLDARFNAKLCDFGVSHVGFYDMGQNRSNRPVVMGSPGYVDPDFLRSGVATEKSDVYSFGVLLLELVTGKEAICPSSGQRLTAIVREGSVGDMVDRRLGEEYDAAEAEVVTAIAMQCVGESPKLRPSMSDVVKVLKEKAADLVSAATARRDSKKRL